MPQRVSLRPRPFATAAVLLAASVAIGACGSSIASPNVAIKTADPTSQPTASAQLEPGIVEAMAIRDQYGLRADEAWIRKVAADPAALIPEEYGIPLMPAELGDLMSRHWPNTLIVQLRAYGGQFPDDFATAYINEKASGAIIEFKSNLDQHRAALAVLPLDGPVVVQQADWSLKELGAFLAKVKAERSWILSTGATWLDPVIYELENRVVIRFEGPRGLEAAIESHFGSPGWLVARWEGPSR